MFNRVNAGNGVVYFSSDLISCRHGFSSRIGGVSTAAHTSSLNLAFGRGDPDETVLDNLRRFSEAVGTDPKSVVSLRQIHSDRVIYAGEALRGSGYYVRSEDECDGYVTDKRGVALGVKTADCVPILFFDPQAEVIGAVHAGWRGTAAGIAGICVDKLIKLGARAESIHAAIGPAIHFCCYEVGEDFRASVTALAGKNLARSFIRAEHGAQRGTEHSTEYIAERDANHGGLHADIVGMNRELLLGRGLTASHIDVCGLCTCCEPELFYSHRYSHGLRGTMLSVISL